MSYPEAIDVFLVGLHFSDSKKAEETREKCTSRKQVIGVTESGDTHPYAEMVGTGWSLLDSRWLLQLKKKSSNEGHHFDLIGNKMVCICHPFFSTLCHIILGFLGFSCNTFIYEKVFWYTKSISNIFKLPSSNLIFDHFTV